MGKCGIKSEHKSHSPQKLGDHGDKRQLLVSMTTEEFKDVVFYLSDIGTTLTSFLEVYPAACKAFHDNEFLIR